MPKTQKVKFNISNVHYALMQRDASTGAISYGTPVHVPGTTSLSLDIDGDQELFYADGVKYWVDNTNRGYNGDWTNAILPDKFREDILREIKDSAGVLYEVEDAEDQVEFAFGFQIDGNAYDTRFWFYDTVASRAKIEANTNEGSRTPQTDSVALTMTGEKVKSGDDRKFVRSKITSAATGTTYEDWFEAVVLPGTFAA